MGQIGLGAMIHHLCGGSEHSATEYYGRTICGAEIVDNRLRLTLDGGKKIEVWDNGQSCCESRYMRTDKGFITITNHNEHNGYYGGFGLTITGVETI